MTQSIPAPIRSDAAKTSRPSAFYVLRVSDDGRHDSALSEELADMGGALLTIDTPEMAERYFSGTQDALPDAFIFSLNSRLGVAMVRHFHRDPVHSKVPTVAMVDAPTEAAFTEAYALGVDDVVLRTDSQGIVERIRGIRQTTRAPEKTTGRALVGASTLCRGRTIARFLEQMSLEAEVVQTPASFFRKGNTNVRPYDLLVCDFFRDEGASILQGVEPLLRLSRTALLVTGTRDPFPYFVSNGPSSVALLSDDAPPDNLIFVANELLHKSLLCQRRSPRLLHNTVCYFRSPAQVGHWGYTYNLSAEGLFVRTLDAPNQGASVTVDFRLPVSGQGVQLHGQVAWVKREGVGGASPRGFGLALQQQHSDPAQWAQFQESYRSLRRAAENEATEPGGQSCTH